MARKKKFAPNDNNLAIAYYRFSSHSQNDASIDQQRELAHEWADAHGFKIVQEYEDAAISGTTDARPGFQQMLSEVAKIRPHTLIMWKTDRLGRDKYVLAMAKKKIRDAGCEIHLLAEHIPTEGPEGVLIEGLMEAMAEYYSRQLSQNIQRGMDYNAQHALYNGHKLFGYDVDRSTKKYIPDPNTAPFVQWAFKEYASGKPLKAIAEEMNAQGSGEKPREPREGHREGRGQRYGDTTPRAARRAEERPERCHRDGKRPRVAVRGQAQHPGVLRQVPACRRERPGDSRPGLRVFRGQGLSVR